MKIQLKTTEEAKNFLRGVFAEIGHYDHSAKTEIDFKIMDFPTHGGFKIIVSVPYEETDDDIFFRDEETFIDYNTTIEDIHNLIYELLEIYFREMRKFSLL